jgi:hypothetical protein
LTILCRVRNANFVIRDRPTQYVFVESVEEEEFPRTIIIPALRKA